MNIDVQQTDPVPVRRKRHRQVRCSRALPDASFSRDNHQPASNPRHSLPQAVIFLLLRVGANS